MAERTGGGRGGRTRTSGTPRRLGIPKPEWGDNVIEADFGSRRRREDAVPSDRPVSAPTTSTTGPSGDSGGSGDRAGDGRTPDHHQRTEDPTPRRKSARRRPEHRAPAANAPRTAEGWAGREILEMVSAGADTARRSRGREYFRSGHVRHLDLDHATVSSLVSGSQLEPFEVSLRWRPLTANQVAYIRGECLAHPENLSQLLAGREPRRDIAVVLCRPGDFRDSWCTCPDRSGMCKHRVAVAYALAEKFTEEPITFLEWRGLDALHLIEELDTRSRAGGGDPGGEAGEAEEVGEPGEPGKQGRRIADDAPSEEGVGERSTVAAPRYSPAEFWGDRDRLPHWGPLDVEQGLDLGDLDARNAVIRKVSWNTVDQLRVLDELHSCYDLLTGEVDGRGEQSFAAEPWLSGASDRIGEHD